MGASTTKVQYLLRQDLKDYMERQKLITNVEIINDKIAIAKGSSYSIYRGHGAYQGSLLYSNFSNVPEIVKPV